MSNNVTITWRAFHKEGEPASAEKTIRLPEKYRRMDDLELCEEFFVQTNLYEGALWDALQPLPERRTHTALSVIFRQGDYVNIDGRVYEVAAVGFRRLRTRSEGI